jgi:hypothetical protein
MQDERATGLMSRQTDNAYPKPLVMPKRNRSGALRLLIVGILLTVAAIVYFVFRDQLGDGFALVLMGILSMVGVFYLFGAATASFNSVRRTASRTSPIPSWIRNRKGQSFQMRAVRSSMPIRLMP